MAGSCKVAIAGYGKAAYMHARALANIPGAELMAVVGRDENKAKAFASTYGIAPYTDIQLMISEKKIDVVVVCTPHPYHKEVTISSMLAGAHVLVEKPLAASLDDCDAMIDSSVRNNKKLGVVSQRRFFKPSQRIRAAIDEGKIGNPALGTVTLLGWRDESYYFSDPWRGKWQTEGGGVLVNQAPHQLDLLQWFMGSEPSELYGIWKNINHPYIEVEDTAVAILQFRNGSLATITTSNSQKPGIFGNVHIHGSNGASVGVETDKGAMFIAGISEITAPARNDIWTIPGEEHLTGIWEAEEMDFFQTIDPVEYYIRLQDADFIEAVMNNHEPLVTAMDGRRTVEIFTAIYRSMNEKKVIEWPL